MSEFIGKYRYSVDDKGRVNIPVKLKKNLLESANGSFVITRGFDGCLLLFPLDIWKHKVAEWKEKLNPYDAEDRSFLRTMTHWANDVQLDKQSRITIPGELLGFAGISSEVILLGMLDNIEIWDPKRYEQYMGNIEPNYESIASKVLGKK